METRAGTNGGSLYNSRNIEHLEAVVVLLIITVKDERRH